MSLQPMEAQMALDEKRSQAQTDRLMRETMRRMLESPLQPHEKMGEQASREEEVKQEMINAGAESACLWGASDLELAAECI
jgi:hypothetical protein